jgi:hypothetical protein
MEWHVLVLAGIGEFGDESAKNLEAKLRKTIEDKCRSSGIEVSYHSLVGSQVNRQNAISSLKRAAGYLEHPNRRVLLYYNGHGDQQRDRNNDEDDGKDEYWKLMGGGVVLDDELSAMFGGIHESSYLWIISDNCSSGTMLDRQLNDRPWILLSSCQDHQDSLASSEGGIFTLFGILPHLTSVDTVRQLAERLRQSIDIPGQRFRLEVTRPHLWDAPLWQKN